MVRDASGPRKGYRLRAAALIWLEANLWNRVPTLISPLNLSGSKSFSLGVWRLRVAAGAGELRLGAVLCLLVPDILLDKLKTCLFVGKFVGDFLWESLDWTDCATL